MKTLQINQVSVIRFDKNGNPINVVAIRVEGKPAILRSFNQFLTDLKESFLISDTVTSMSDPEVLDVLADLQGGVVRGNIAFHKAGDEYTIDENHNALTNENHKLYGKVVMGQKVKAEKDGARVTEGFLTLKREITAQAIHKQASAYAGKRLALEGFFNSLGSSNTSNGNAEPEVEDFDLDETESLKSEVVGEGKK